MSEPDVLIVGAGPTGMTAAIELARRNVNVRIIERRTEPTVHSKALVMHARTLELMDILGIADEMVSRGYTSPGIEFSANLEKPLRANAHKLKTQFSYILVLPQAETEEILERELNKLGVEIERGCLLTGFTDTEDAVCCTVEHSEGETFRIDAHYVIGSDGVNSTVRKTLDLPFEGYRYGWTAFLGDVRLHGHHAEGGTEQHFSNRGLGFIVPFKDGSHRIVTIDRKHQSGSKTNELNLDELQDSISAILEKQVELSDPKWLTRWGSSLRIVPQYRVGHVFLGGDAAHTHSPAGGQGMNTGIQDAFNLGWKLAFVIKGEIPEALLNTYNSERYPLGKRALRVSNLLLRSLLVRQPLLRRFRQMFFRIFIPLLPVQRKITTTLSGLGVCYQTGEGELAGVRMPDMELMNDENERVRLYQLLSFHGYTLLLFIDPDQALSARKQIDQILGNANEMLKSYVIFNSGLPKSHNFEVSTLVDYRGEFENSIGVKTGRIILLRPDAYIAIDLDVLDANHFQNLLRKWKTDKPPSPDIEIFEETQSQTGRSFSHSQ